MYSGKVGRKQRPLKGRHAKRLRDENWERQNSMMGKREKEHRSSTNHSNMTEVQRWSSRWYHNLVYMHIEEPQSFRGNGYLNPCVHLLRLTSRHCSLQAGICQTHWRRIQVLLGELETSGLCCSGCLQTHLSMTSSFLLSELTYGKGLGILQVIRTLSPASISGGSLCPLCCPSPSLCYSCKLASGKSYSSS